MLNSKLKNKKRKAALLCIIAACSLLLKEDDLKPKQRRWWVRPWLLNKKMGGLSLIDRFRDDPGQFKQFLRLDEHCFRKLLNLVKRRLTKKKTFFRESISAKQQLIVTLRFLATGETFRSLMYAFRIHESTISLFVPNVCQAIYDSLKSEYLKIPREKVDWLKVAKDFEDIWNLPHCIGALDGKHILFRPARSAGSTFFNYKGQNSIVLLALVDAQYKFLYVDVGKNGRMSDGGVFRDSTLALAIDRNTLKFPEDKSLPGRHKKVPYVFVADAAFPLSERILKPFPFRDMTEEQRIFNYRLSRARRVVENAFGILANRFRIFLTTIDLNERKVELITLACCALHNFLRTDCPTSIAVDEYDKNYKSIHALSVQGMNRPKNSAIDIRNEFMQYVNNEGAVGWQNNLV